MLQTILNYTWNPVYKYLRDLMFAPPEADVDSALKRFSMTDLLMPYRGWVFPTGSVDQATRQAFMWTYSGILAAAVSGFAGKVNTVANPAAVNSVANPASISGVS